MPSKTDFCVRSLTQLADSKRLFVLGAANDRKEPDSAICILCCVRTQRENRCRCIDFDAEMPRLDRPLMHGAARIGTRTRKKRDSPDIGLIFSDAGVTADCDASHSQ